VAVITFIRGFMYTKKKSYYIDKIFRSFLVEGHLYDLIGQQLLVQFIFLWEVIALIKIIKVFIYL